MLVHFGDPEEFAGRRLDRVHAGDQVGKISDRTSLGFSLTRFDEYRRANLGTCAEAPAYAARLLVECVYRSVLTADEYGAERHGGLRAHALGIGEGERPFQFEFGQVVRGESGNVRRNETMILAVDTPAHFLDALA
jgi:hypothetical protein